MATSKKQASNEVKHAGAAKGVKQAKGNPAKAGNEFSKLAEKHIKTVMKSESSAMEDIKEAVTAGAASDENAVKRYTDAFRNAGLSIAKLSQAAARVYASERGRILKAWNLKSDKIEGDKTFGEMVSEQAHGYNKTKKLAAELFGKQRKSRVTKNTTETPIDGTKLSFGEILQVFDLMTKALHKVEVQSVTIRNNMEGKELQTPLVVDFAIIREAICEAHEEAHKPVAPVAEIRTDANGNQELQVIAKAA